MLRNFASKLINVSSLRLRKQSLQYNMLSTVARNTIHITFVDEDGNRATVPAILGQSILEVAQNHKVDIEGPCNGGAAPPQEKRSENWTEYTFGEGPSCFGCHVQIPSKFSHLLEPSSETETVGLTETWEDEKLNTSRLACLIKLERKHDGLVIFIPDAPPMDIM